MDRRGFDTHPRPKYVFQQKVFAPGSASMKSPEDTTGLSMDNEPGRQGDRQVVRVAASLLPTKYLYFTNIEWVSVLSAHWLRARDFGGSIAEYLLNPAGVGFDPVPTDKNNINTLG